MNPDWLDEGSWMAEDRFEDEGDGMADYLGEAIVSLGEDDDD